MSSFKKYILNPETLMYEIKEVSAKSRVLKWFSVLAAGAGLGFLYFWLFTSVLGLELPKTALLKMQNAKWSSKIDLMNRKLDKYDAVLSSLEMRDDDIYRLVFGMNEIPSAVRNAGFGGVNRYAYLDVLDNNSQLKKTTVRLDILTKKTYVQSKSFDEVMTMARKAGDMASCIPAIPPINPDHRLYRLSSGFGFRSDPFTGRVKMHTGQDFACHTGNPVYATGDGVVEKVSYDFFGYGNSVLIDHGFGYETRYAHMKLINVSDGMKIKRGDCIGETGNSGRSTGPHLHYEVIYRGHCVNPVNYFDLSMSDKEYSLMVKKRENESEAILTRPSRRMRR
ncbi:MAG: M23 family metallopeptidase [Bacteroidales bacterium]|jgi:hypothetical protein|nr:M23 family metallopeptidase [Bacteroidales bacterium]MCI1785680.1 M23 family metallopeptidase [Bacteroidales bacterium]